MQNFTIVLISFLTITITLTALVALLVAVVLLHAKRQLVLKQNLETMRNQYEKALLATQLEIQEQAFTHIAREIHDNINHYLTLAKLHLNGLRKQVSPDQQETLVVTIDLMTKVFHDLRDISHNLGAGIIRKLGLSGAIEDQVEQLRRTSQFTVEFFTLGNYNYQDEAKETFLFRILQEAIHNIIRHADARTIRIVLDCSGPGSIQLTIEDDGKGFEVGVLDRHSGGIGNMVNRAKVIEAQFTIQSQPGNGTLVKITVPQITQYA